MGALGAIGGAIGGLFGGAGGASQAKDQFAASLSMQIAGMAQNTASQNAKAAEKQIQDHKKRMDEIAAEGQ